MRSRAETTSLGGSIRTSAWGTHSASSASLQAAPCAPNPVDLKNCGLPRTPA